MGYVMPGVVVPAWFPLPHGIRPAALHIQLPTNGESRDLDSASAFWAKWPGGTATMNHLWGGFKFLR